jgi:YesN/AraC family two-component response regulator
MPGLNGLQVYNEVQAIRPETKILFCSGYTEDEVVKQGGLSPGVNLLLKPYSPKELLMKIREVINNGP